MLRRFISSCWTPFCAVSGLDPSKRGPPHLTSDLPPCPAAWTPVCAESGLDPPKRGPVTWLQIFASGSTFSAALPHEDAVPVLVPCSACGRLHSVQLETPPFCSNICRACPVWRLEIPSFLFQHLQSMPFIQGSPSSPKAGSNSQSSG